MFDSGLPPVLQIDNLSVEIEGARLLDAVSLELAAGEVLALVGPNGAGKSTLLRALTGEQGTSAGQVRFHGRAIGDWPAREQAQHLAVLPQKSVLEFPFTAREVVALARTPHATGREQDKQIVDQVLSYLDVAHLADRLYPQLSGGEQQRVQLARVLAQIWLPQAQPRLLLLDEPSSYFDLAHQQLLIKLVREMAAEDVSILVVLHDLNLAVSCADRVAVLCCGQLHACGPAQDVLDSATIAQVFGVEADFFHDSASGRRFIALRQPAIGSGKEVR